MSIDTTFCKTCGMPLCKKLNRRFEGNEGKYRKFCNDICAKRRELKDRPRAARKNHGVVGW